jgi:hypothetical protein
MVSFKKDIGEYAVDHSLFNHTYEVDTPLCSAKDWDELRAVQEEMKRQGNIVIVITITEPTTKQNSCNLKMKLGSYLASKKNLRA